MRRATEAMRAAGLLAVVVALSGCWLQVGHGPAHQWSNPFENRLTGAFISTLSEAWFTDLGASEVGAPVVLGGRVYVPYLTGISPGQAHVAALDATDGEVVWTHEVGLPLPETLVGTVVFVGDELWAEWFGADPVNVTCGGGVERIDPDTGALLGTELPNGQSTAAVAFGESVASTRTTFGVVDCALVDGPWLTVQDAATRAVQWRASSGVDQGDLPYVVGDKIVVGGTTAYASAGCGASTCAPVWSASVPDGIQLFGASTVGVFGGTGARRLVALDLDDGSQSWQASLPSFAEAIAVAGNRVYVTTFPDRDGVSWLQVFNAEGCFAATCTPLWTAPLGANAGQPVVAGGAVYVPTATAPAVFDQVQIFKADGCRSSTCIPFHSLATPVSELVVAGGRVFGVSQGGLRAFAPDLTPRDSVTGRGTVELVVDGQPNVTTDFTFAARSGPNGEDPTGQVSLDELFVEAAVTCLDVRTRDGGTVFNEATMNLATSELGLVTLQVSDGNPEGIPDFISARTNSSRSPTDCSPLAFGTDNVRGAVETGDIDLVNVNPAQP